MSEKSSVRESGVKRVVEGEWGNRGVRDGWKNRIERDGGLVMISNNEANKIL